MIALEKFRSRLFFCLLYPDNESHLKALEIIKNSVSHVGILHDCDTWMPDDEVVNPEHKAGEKKKAHYHVILKYANPRWNTGVAVDLGIDARFLEACGSFDKSGRYLLHDGFPDKYQYDMDCLFGDLAPGVAKLVNQVDECTRVKRLMDLIDCSGVLDLRKLIDLACDHGLYGDLRRMGSWVFQLIDSHNSKVARASDGYSELISELRATRLEQTGKWEQTIFDE